MESSWEIGGPVEHVVGDFELSGVKVKNASFVGWRSCGSEIGNAVRYFFAAGGVLAADLRSSSSTFWVCDDAS